MRSQWTPTPTSSYSTTSATSSDSEEALPKPKRPHVAGPKAKALPGASTAKAKPASPPPQAIAPTPGVLTYAVLTHPQLPPAMPAALTHARAPKAVEEAMPAALRRAQAPKAMEEPPMAWVAKIGGGELQAQWPAARPATPGWVRYPPDLAYAVVVVAKAKPAAVSEQWQQTAEWRRAHGPHA